MSASDTVERNATDDLSHGQTQQDAVSSFYRPFNRRGQTRHRLVRSAEKACHQNDNFDGASSRKGQQRRHVADATSLAQDVKQKASDQSLEA